MTMSRKRMLAFAGRGLAALALVSLPQAGWADLAPPRGRAITADIAFMVGSWTDDGDCTHAARLDADGRFHSAEGNEGLWVIVGGRLTLTGSSTLTMQVTPIDRNTIAVVNADGSPGRSTRCAAPRGAAGGVPARVRLDRAFLIGRWTDDGDCTAAADFRADGRFIASTGVQGTWRLDGNRMTMSGISTLLLTIVAIDRNTINIVNQDGSLGRSSRC
jgi:hypothetical protein